jgi:hypothetical protein
MRDLKLKTIIRRFVKELQSENSSIILDPFLIQDILNNVFPEPGYFVEHIDDDIDLDWGYKSSPLQYELDFTENYPDGTNERSGMFIRIYLTATYKEFTLKNALMYGEEISDFIFNKAQGNGNIGKDYFFKTMKQFNKNLPEDLKLFLELNY